MANDGKKRKRQGQNRNGAKRGGGKGNGPRGAGKAGGTRRDGAGAGNAKGKRRRSMKLEVGAVGTRGGGGGGKRRRKQRPAPVDSSAAALGSKLARYGGIQGVSLLLSNLLHALTVIYVARQLGPADLGVYTLLWFLAGGITQVFHLFSKPGTLRRTFGQADDDDAGAEGDFAEEGEERDDEQSETPQRSLGVGIIWVALLGLAGATITILLRSWIAGILLGDSSQADLVLWAGILGGVGAIFKLTEIVIWFEGRGWTFVVVDALRPTLNLVFMAYLIQKGMGVKGAIMGATIGTSLATIISIIPLLRSFEPAFELREVGLIVQRGLGRMPIAMSMFTIQNADGFLLSRFVDHKQLGLYQLAQKLGFVVSFLPQGFRIALRPLRKTAMFQAVRDQYGSSVAKGQLLVYFLLISIFAILAMVLGGELLINVASSQYQAAAPLIPLTAAMMTMPALFRTVNGQSFFPHKRAFFISCVIFAAISFVGWIFLLVPRFGIIGMPICSLLGFGIPTMFLFVKNQLGKGKIEFRYGAVIGAAAIASAIALFFRFVHPANKWLEVVEIVALLAVFVVLLLATGIVPRIHRRALAQMAKGAIFRAPAGFDRLKGLKALKQDQRQDLRRAIVERIPAESLAAAARAEGPGATGNGIELSGDGAGALAGPLGDGGPADPLPVRARTALLTRRRAIAPPPAMTTKEAARLVRLLRRVGRKGGLTVAKPGEFDARIAKFLYADAPPAARNATMRSLVAAGADAKDLHKLEELRQYLAKAPGHVWAGRRRRRRVPVQISERLRRS
jgi:O-antigen/teichoic acid export membrane protein